MQHLIWATDNGSLCLSNRKIFRRLVSNLLFDRGNEHLFPLSRFGTVVRRLTRCLAENRGLRLRSNGRWPRSRVLKCLPIVDDATTEAVAVVPARALVASPSRALPAVLRTGNLLEFCGRAMLTWAHTRGVTLRLIEPGKPTQNAYIESSMAGCATSA